MTAKDLTKYMVSQPLRELKSGSVKNRTSPPLTYRDGSPESDWKYDIKLAWIWGIPEPNPPEPGHTSTFDEIVLHIGGDGHNAEDLGAVIEYTVGGQTLKIDSTGAIFVPAGTEHGQTVWKEFYRPHVQMRVLLRGFRSGLPSGTNIDYEKYLVRKPAYEVVAGTPVKNRQGPSSMTFISNELIPGCNIYLEGGWVWGMPDPNPHIFEHDHGFEEFVVHFGTDYNNPEKLGAEIDFYLDGQPLRVNKTSVVYAPKDIKHGPLIWREYSMPHLEMAIMPGAGTLAEVDPGGHQKKMQGRKD